VPNIFNVVDLVRRDVFEGLSNSIEPRDDDAFALAEGFEFIADSPVSDADGRVAVVPWRWRGAHVQPILGIEASGRELLVRGVTLITGGEEEELLHRYVDWADVLQQLDARFYPRPVVDGLARWHDELLEIDQFAALAEDGLIR
jgi:hypothetical protein